MFRSASMILLQNQDPTTNLWKNWLEVRLFNTRLNQTSPKAPAAVPGSMDEKMRAFPQYTYWGRWQTRGNSVSQGINDTTYTIGTSANPQYKIWRWSPSARSLAFTEIMPVSSGPDDVLDTVVLANANVGEKLLNGPDIDPGTGIVLVPSNILTRGAVTWDPGVYFD